MVTLHLHEDVPEDPDGSHGWRDVEPHEAGEADLLAARLDPHHVVLARQGKLLPADDEVDVGQTDKGGGITQSWCNSRVTNSMVLTN